MKKLVVLLVAFVPAHVWAQCNLTDASDCDCADGSANCDLLPDITGSYDILVDPSGLIENAGLLQLSVGTPNIGHGPLRVLPTDYYICSGDTIYSTASDFYCPDGTDAHQIIQQRIYRKDGNDMSYWSQDAGTMTYHPTHGHFHTDNWGIYTIRKEIIGVENPLEWPIIGNGSKMGFCLMDLANCASPYYEGDCVEDDGSTIGSEIENYGLGGGNYNCGVTNQGISVGYLDIYDYYLDGMSIDIPEGVCNGDYKLVVEIDPFNNYLEESDDNNLIVADITLTEQPEDVDFATVFASGDLIICGTDVLELSAPSIGSSYLWSNGATTATIAVTEAGSYSCEITRECGPLTTNTVEVTAFVVSNPETTEMVEVCEGTTVVLEASGDGEIAWYTDLTGGVLLATGSEFTTPALFSTTHYFVQNTTSTLIEIDQQVGQIDHAGSEYSTGSAYNGFQVFDAMADFTLQSVKVYTDFEGLRTIELRNESGTVLQSLEVNITEGTTVIDLNFDITEGSNYELGTNDESNETSFGNISPQLKRSSEGTSYPYSIDDVVSITNSSYDETRWYYFYDWQVIASKEYICNSERTDIEAKVVVCTGISEIAGIKDFEIFPNPSNGYFNVTFDIGLATDVSIKIVNTLGQTIETKTIINGVGMQNAQFNTGNLASGIYNVEVATNNKAVKKQIVIE